MNEPFLPFGGGTPTPPPAPFRPRVMPAGAATKPFVPATHAAPQQAQAEPCTAEPRVVLRRDGDRITHIEVHCACGRHIELECVF